MNNQQQTVFRATNNIFQRSILIFLVILGLVFTFSYNAQSFILFYWAMCAALIIWISSIRMILNNEILVFKTLLSTSEINIGGIVSISSYLQTEGQFRFRKIFIKTSEDQPGDLLFNYRYFGKDDLIRIFDRLTSINPNIEFDESIVKLTGYEKKE